MLESGYELTSRFVLERRLGVGGYGEVWLAQDRERGEKVALKILALNRIGTAQIAALEHEYEAVNQLNHQNILRMHGVYRTQSFAWIEMQYAAGGDLSRLRGRPSSEILKAAVPIASALAHAHAAGVVHRDVKPSNVLLMADGTPKLSDFGIATVLSSGGMQASGGSPFSMSPQQLDGEPARVSDDVYAFGAMLYELLSGYPPFYPDARAERIRNERPACLPAPVPENLASFIDGLLAKASDERPATMDTVESELKELAKADATRNAQPPPVHIEPPSVRATGAHGEPLRGEWRRAANSNVSEQQLRSEGFRRGLGVSVIALGLLAVAIVFFALPRWMEQQAPVRDPQVASTEQSAAEIEPQQKQKEIDFAALAKAKQEAEEVRGGIDARLQKLRERGAESWGGAELQRAQEELAAGDKDMQGREYVTALQHFKNIEPLLGTMETRAPEVLRAQLDAGMKALQEGRSADAKSAFELAAKLDPNSQAAAAGLKRASTLDEVMQLVATAERAEKEGQPQVALEHYRKALALDAQAPRAAEATARIESQMSNEAFASAMARGFSALANADHASARSAFEAAGKIRPSSPEVAQALGQIAQEQRTGVIGTKLRAAQTLESQEQWAEALKEYRAVIELDSTIAAANEGIARVSPRAALNEQLELYLTQPERLFSQPVRAAAHETLSRAKTVASPGPVLQRQIGTLADWLARADVPVEVALQSDDQTQVTIYRVGSLGTFQQRSLELAPGTYTVVGTRPGYRDVRRQIDVIPGAPLGPVVIRCEDKI
jgi:hypothetical protein